jgi:hypothetical protein
MLLVELHLPEVRVALARCTMRWHAGVLQQEMALMYLGGMSAGRRNSAARASPPRSRSKANRGMPLLETSARWA